MRDFRNTLFRLSQDERVLSFDERKAIYFALDLIGSVDVDNTAGIANEDDPDRSAWSCSVIGNVKYDTLVALGLVEPVPASPVVINFLNDKGVKYGIYPIETSRLAQLSVTPSPLGTHTQVFSPVFGIQTLLRGGKLEIGFEE